MANGNCVSAFGLTEQEAGTDEPLLRRRVHPGGDAGLGQQQSHHDKRGDHAQRPLADHLVRQTAERGLGRAGSAQRVEPRRSRAARAMPTGTFNKINVSIATMANPPIVVRVNFPNISAVLPARRSKAPMRNDQRAFRPSA